MVNQCHIRLSNSVHCGVAQDSTLGRLLFALYVNNLANTFKHCANHHFAEDTNLLYANSNIQDIMNAEKDLLKDLTFD